MEAKQTFFEKKIKPILLYIGSIGAIITSIAYIILMLILVLGFKADITMKQSLTFAVINAVVGFMMMQFLKIQGIDFAKNLNENQIILNKWNKKKPKKKRSHSLGFFWFKTITLDILVKTLTIIIMITGIIYIVIEGSHDYNMLLMSFVNLLMFICFGFISLAKAYDYFNNNYIPYIIEQIEEKQGQIQGDVENVQITEQ